MSLVWLVGGQIQYITSRMLTPIYLIKMQNGSSPQGSLMPPFTATASTVPNPYPNLCSHKSVLHFSNYINGITQYVPFENWLFFQPNSLDIHASGCIYQVHSFLLLSTTTLWLGYNIVCLTICPLNDIWYFQFGLLKMKLLWTWYTGFAWTQVFISLRLKPKTANDASYGNCMFSFLRHYLVAFQSSGVTFHPHSNAEEILCLVILTSIWCCHCFYFGHSNRYVVTAYCGFILYFPNG